MSTICAPSTASGGAIGIIRVSGPDAIALTDTIFSRSIIERKAYTAIYGSIYDSEQTIIDDVILTLYRAPHSYTGEDTVEIAHHGSRYIQQKILSVLMQKGCTMAMPGEFTQRAFLNGKLDLSQAEAVADLIASNTAAAHKVAMNQMRGGISKKLSVLRDKLLNLTSLLELEIDFSDHEDLEFADRSELLVLAEELEDEIKRLIDSFSAGNALKNGIPVAIIGAPNVGKSTLLNQLLEDDKAIVSDIQGTTRDLVEDTMIIDGILFRIIDTAGIRRTDDLIEQKGIERSHKAARQAQIVILLTEPGIPYPEIEQTEGQTVIRVLNKIDVQRDTQTPSEITISALKGIGIDVLRQKLTSSVTRPSSDEVLITNLRHKQALDLALQDLRQAIQSIKHQIGADLISEDLRQCISHLSEITGGQITPDEVLGNIFKHFCIGK